VGCKSKKSHCNGKTLNQNGSQTNKEFLPSKQVIAAEQKTLKKN
jgi:hypothetical protein